MSNETVSIRSKVIDVVKSRMEMTRVWLVRIEAHDSDDDTQMFMGEMLHIIVDGHRELNQLQVDDLEQKKEQLLNVLSNLPTTDNISNEENFALFRSIRTATNELGMQVYDLITTLQVLIRGQPKERKPNAVPDIDNDDAPIEELLLPDDQHVQKQNGAMRMTRVVSYTDSSDSATIDEEDIMDDWAMER